MKAVNDFGMDAELAKKRAANYDKGLEERTQVWIQNVTNQTCDKDFGEWIKDGQVLCALVNSLMPGRIKKINTGGGIWKLQENITAFVRVCREIGVAEASLFPTESLYQLKDLQQVLNTISAFSGKVQQRRGELGVTYDGPFLGPPAKAGASGGGTKKKWVVKPGGSSGMSMLNAGSAGVMEKTTYSNAREAIKTGAVDGKGQGSGLSMLNAGSYGIMEKTEHSDAREAIKGGKVDGKGAGTGVSMMNAGSHGIMEKTTHSDAREAIKTGAVDGKGQGSGLSMLNAGSYGIMEKTEHSDAREAIKGGKVDGKGAGTGVSMMNAGSHGIMEKTKHSDAREGIKTGTLDGKGVGNSTSRWNDGSAGIMQKTGYSDAREEIKKGNL
mmetsp:Transcript_15645/g.20078  ORF Transcript_15645/g.20078 Transcript_15645/m.20078 type:complete len:383 (-) Transcript_15645:247-1395(-)